MVKITELNIEKLSAKKFITNSKIANKIREIKKKINYDLTELLPDDNYEVVSFKLSNTNSSMANAIRRVLISELPVWSLTLKTESLKTDDFYIRYDDLADRINSLPIHQDIFNNTDEPEKYIMFSLHAKNDTSEIMDVLSADIDVTYHSKVKQEKNKLFEESVVLQKLRDGHYLDFELVLEKGFGFQHGGKFSATKNPIYRPSDNPLIASENSGQSSLISNPREFYFSYETYGTYSNPLSPLLISLKEIERRIILVIDDIEKYLTQPKVSDKKIYAYASNILIITKNFNTFIIEIKNESTTISKLFSRYIYELKPDIKFVSDLAEHPSKRIVKIKISDDDGLQLMIDSGKKIIKDLHMIKI